MPRRGAVTPGTAQRRVKAAKQALAVLSAAFDGASVAVFVKDRGGCYVMLNPAAGRFLGKLLGAQSVSATHRYSRLRRRTGSWRSTGARCRPAGLLTDSPIRASSSNLVSGVSPANNRSLPGSRGAWPLKRSGQRSTSLGCLYHRERYRPGQGPEHHPSQSRTLGWRHAARAHSPVTPRVLRHPKLVLPCRRVPTMRWATRRDITESARPECQSCHECGREIRGSLKRPLLPCFPKKRRRIARESSRSGRRPHARRLFGS